MSNKSITQQLNEAYEESKVTVVCLWPESGAVGPIYGYERHLPYDDLIKMMRKIMAAVTPHEQYEYPGPQAFDWPLSHRAMEFIYCLESATSSAECEMVLRKLGWEKK